MENKYDPQEYERLVQAQHERFPPLTLPPEYAELIEVNTLMMLIKLARYKFAARMLKPSDEVLEVGSGTGLGALFLAQHSKQVTGLEIKQHDFDAACSVNRRDNVAFRHESLFDHDPARKYDAVVSLDVIEHLPADEGRKFVARIATHTKPEGIAVIGTPSIYSYPYQGKYSQAAHVKCYDRDELLSLIDSFYARTVPFSMNDEVVHTGHPKMSWYYFVLGFMPRRRP